MLVAEGLSGLINREIELGILSGFRVRASYFMVSHLQYLSDTLILEDPSIENIWTIKVILRVLS